MCLAIPAKIVELSSGEESRALVRGRRRAAAHRYGPASGRDPASMGDWVLVHVGFAMSKISEEQALDQLRMLTMLGEKRSCDAKKCKVTASSRCRAGCESGP